MLLEVAVVSGLLYFGSTGSSVRQAARAVGRVLGRASGSLRRVRAEVDRLHARAEVLGGQGLRDSRVDIASRMARLRAIQAEAAALTSVGGGGGAAFSDAEVAAALRAPLGGASGGAALPSGAAPPGGAPPVVAYHPPAGRPVIVGHFERVWPAAAAASGEVGRHPEWGYTAAGGGEAGEEHRGGGYSHAGEAPVLRDSPDALVARGRPPPLLAAGIGSGGVRRRPLPGRVAAILELCSGPLPGDSVDARGRGGVPRPGDDGAPPLR